VIPVWTDPLVVNIVIVIIMGVIVIVALIIVTMSAPSSSGLLALASPSWSSSRPTPLLSSSSSPLSQSSWSWTLCDTGRRCHRRYECQLSRQCYHRFCHEKPMQDRTRTMIDLGLAFSSCWPMEATISIIVVIAITIIRVGVIFMAVVISSHLSPSSQPSPSTLYQWSSWPSAAYRVPSSSHPALPSSRLSTSGSSF